MRTRLFLLALALVAFGASLGSGFHFDDYGIFSDPILTSESGWSELWTAAQARPLTYLTLWLNFQIGGGDALGYHLLNLFLHLGAVLLAYECLSRLIPGHAALVAAAVFAIHPIQAEAVNYIWARGIVLATVFCLASLLAWLNGRRWLAAALFVVALLANEEAAAFPLVLLLLDRKHLAPLCAMMAASLATGLRVIYATSAPGGASTSVPATVSAWEYLLAQSVSVLRYLRLFLVPYGFTIDPDIQVPPVWLGLLVWLLILASIVAVGRYAGRSVLLYYAAGLILLIPSSSIFPLEDLAADQRMYLPMLAFSAAAGLMLARFKPITVAMIVVVALTGLSFARTQVWMTDERLWSEAHRRAPEKVRPMVHLARALPAARGLELLSQARAISPDDATVASEMGAILLREGQPDAAVTEFARALALDPMDAETFNNRGVALQQLGQIDAARADFRRALELDPFLNEARQNLEKLPGQ